MSSLFNNMTISHDKYDICLLDCGKTMGTIKLVRPSIISQRLLLSLIPSLYQWMKSPHQE